MGKSGPLNYGNYNLKGKKTQLLGCQCCVCLDKREQMIKKSITKEMFEDPYEDGEDETFDYWDWIEERQVWKEYNAT